MYLIKKYKLKTWYGFDDDIYNAARDFFKKKKIFANIVVFNDHTYEQICFLISCSPKRKDILDDEGEAELTISNFQFEDCSLLCGTTDQLKDKEFELIYDDQCASDDGSDDEPETIIFDPTMKSELVFV